jgi:RNA polymerase sigma-70 factor (ECF subfamily)
MDATKGDVASAVDTERDPRQLSELMRALYAQGRARWAALPALPPEDFAAYLAVRVPADADPAAYLATLVAEDLYLACACVRDLPGAVRAFDAEWLSRVPSYVDHLDRSPGFGEEIQQQLRERLLVRRPDAPPRIADYSGRGALASWLRVTAVRTALNHRARPDEARPDDAAMVERLAAEAGDVELHVLRARYADALTAALKRAVAALAPEQRVLLRMYFAAGHTTEQIAAILRVNRSTAARRLVAARQAVFDATHAQLRAVLPIATGEFASLARALVAQLDVSLGGLLAD